MDAHELIARIVDGSRFAEFKALYGETLVCGFARIEGYPVAILAGKGVLFAESAQRAPTSSSWPRSEGSARLPAEHHRLHGREGVRGGRIARDGAELVTAVACADVPKFTVVTGGSFGAGNYAMCGRAQATPTLDVAERAHLGHGRRAGGGSRDDGRRRRLRRDPCHLRGRGQPYSTARLWDDGIIDPRDTRVLALGISSRAQRPCPPSTFGIFRM